MLKQMCPNPWSCLATSFAIIFDMPVRDIFRVLGHDGSEIYWPDLEEPYNRRGFHIQELIKVGWLMDYSITPFVGSPRVVSLDANRPIAIPFETDFVKQVMRTNMGVLTGIAQGKRHAIAWDGTHIHDPGNLIKTVEEFGIESFWAVTLRLT